MNAKYNCGPLIIPLHGTSTWQISVRHSYAGVLSNLTLVGICFCCQNLGNLLLGRFEKLSLPIEPKTPARTLRIDEYVRGRQEYEDTKKYKCKCFSYRITIRNCHNEA
jgi:hypothetical protein